MTDHAAPTTAAAGAHAEEHKHHGPHHPPSYYVKTWAILVVLLVVSIIGPEIGIFWVTMVTAFGIACVKAYLVAARFMHLNVEKRLASVIVLMALVLLALFFAGVAPDVMKHQGDQWVNAAAMEETRSRLEREGTGGEKIKKQGADH
jgi:caa(3)-type oxidase subunit IV